MSARHIAVSSFLAISVLCLVAACSGPGVTNVGGGGTGTPTPEPTGNGVAVTYYKDVLPVVQKHCQACHTTGGASFALDTFSAASPYAGPISGAVTSGIMPPWPPDPNCRHFVGERVLTPDEQKVFVEWNSTGATAGNPADAPPPLTPPPTAAIPDRSLDAGGDYTYNPGAQTDLYWCFRLDPNIANVTTLVGADIVPGNKQIVHHVIVFREANGKGSAMGLPGFSCNGAPGEFLFAWVPGAAPLTFPPGYGMQLQTTDALLMQVHYHTVPSAASNTDRTSASLYFSPTPPTKLVHVSWLGTPTINIPANSDASASGTCTIPSGGSELLMTAPHMHTLATKFNSTINFASGAAPSCMIDIPRWQFGWQGGYEFPQSLMLNAGDSVTSTCTWHNNTSSSVGFGEGTGSEMCFNFVYSVGALPQYCFL